MSGKYKIGIIGAGRIGRLHTENISRMVPSVEIIGIADVNMNEETRLWAESLNIPLATGDAMDLIGNPDIKAVVICSSTSTHADFIIAAARAGKHIFCEKPIDLSVQKGLEAIKVAKEAGVKLQLGFNRRFDHNFQHIRELGRTGQVGDIQIVKITSRDPAPPSAAYVAVSGGIFLDMMIHDFDMARFQAGSEITEVYATGAVLVDPEIGKAGDIDTAIVTLKFANGAIGVIDNSRQAVYGYDQRVEVFGSKGSAQCENDTANSVTLATVDGVKGEKPLHFFLERYKDAYIGEITSFVEAILKDTAVEVGGEDGFEDMVAALAAGKSLKEHRPVTIKEMKKELGV
ncbi:putative dehydrogenase [Sphaerochaeta pleomorpha str. Grapes]|uniref:Putative dehydrogenase n=1 Tax=Sphaerochaeta pleomorpha (strain ATCC BAA-1885 / DSM 22778 / Grapes) TaxID=158190 RepID=G8QZ25_SPHPG|nr:inositol 2-dehydrogenase [Sphaerochaeta pleomorpha]AEV30884.1 putative dehydrogenase [Sphaerochaeta pleomorpha str. Grapes]